MTGAEHYQAGEAALEQSRGPNITPGRSTRYVRLAQAHFMAAQAAATALAASSIPHGWPNCADDIKSWHAVAAS